MEDEQAVDVSGLGMPSVYSESLPTAGEDAPPHQGTVLPGQAAISSAIFRTYSLQPSTARGRETMRMLAAQALHNYYIIHNLFSQHRLFTSTLPHKLPLHNLYFTYSIKK